MTFEEWFKTSGYTITALANAFGLSHLSMSRIVKGKAPRLSTILRMVQLGKRLGIPISIEMFPLVYKSGMQLNTIVPTHEAYEAYLKRKRTPVKASTYIEE